MYVGVGSGGRFRKVPKGWFWKVSEGSGGFWRVPACFGVGSETGFGRFRKVPVWFVALQPWEEQPCDCFDHKDNIVHMGKTTAQKGAHVVKYGIRHKDVYATAVGDTTKAYLFFHKF